MTARSAADVRDALQHRALILEANWWAPSREDTWAVIKCLELPWLNKPAAERKAIRYGITRYIFGRASTKELSEPHIAALLEWVNMSMLQVVMELRAVNAAALVAAGQRELELS